MYESIKLQIEETFVLRTTTTTKARWLKANFFSTTRISFMMILQSIFRKSLTKVPVQGVKNIMCFYYRFFLKIIILLTFIDRDNKQKCASFTVVYVNECNKLSHNRN